MHGRRPVIFCTNGYEHWLWDDQMYPPRGVSDFLKKDELVLLHQRRGTRQVLDDVDKNIAQTRAIRRVNEALEHLTRQIVYAIGAQVMTALLTICPERAGPANDLRPERCLWLRRA